MKVADAMTPDPITVLPESGLDETIDLLDSGDIRHLPVVADGVLLGVVSDRDVLLATGGLPARLLEARGCSPPEDRARIVRDVMTQCPVAARKRDELASACRTMSHHGIGCLPVIDDEGLEGILTETDALRAFLSWTAVDDPGDEANPPVADLMSKDVIGVEVNATLSEAAELLLALSTRHLPVLQDSRLHGILSDRDVRRAYGCGRRNDYPVHEVCTGAVVTVEPDTPLSMAVGKAYGRKISALPVVEDEILVGILTVTDVLRHCSTSCWTQAPVDRGQRA